MFKHLIVSAIGVALAGGLTALAVSLQQHGLGNPFLNTFAIGTIMALVAWLKQSPIKKDYDQ